MEEKRRDSAGTLAFAGSSGDSPASEPMPAPRRRGGGLKRKANALGGSNFFSSAPSKRMLTREKAMLASFSPVHNGPLTRARQAPSIMPSAADGVKSEVLNVAVGADGEKPKEEEERNKAIREWEALEAKIEADFEAIRSRDSNVHVVPNHCGWFSWEKIHPLEERSLPSFFNGKLEGRTSEVYREIRNWIMGKFHSNPNIQIELKDLTELEVGDSEAKQEVMEFLDYWGLINFHPFPPTDTGSTASDHDDLGDKESLLNSLYRFQVDEACPPLVHKPRFTAQATPSGLFPDPMAADELLKQEGPAVEYHCNSCSADCSRKRYHCPKQADFDLCTECFNSGKFSSDMSSSDFILMEPAEAPGVGSGKWTDQETLLLLEALEIFKENWNEIAEHVATKTKAQCMLHFLQMPIEDAFLDQIDYKDPISKDTTDLAVSKDDNSVLKDAPEEAENKKRVDEDETMKEVPEPEDGNEEKVSQESSKPGDASEETNEMEAEQKTPKLETAIEERCKDEADENIALKALTEAFEDVGHSSTPEASFSFADLGNPVMGLAAFLVRLAGSDVATASARASIKSLHSNSGMLLATRHCYILEDPPDNKKDPTKSKSADAEGNDDNSHKDDQPEEKSKKAEEVSLNSDDREMPDTDTGKETQDSVSEEKQPGSRTENSTTKLDAVQEKRSSKPVTTDNSEKPVDIICPSQDKCSGKELQEPLKDGNKLSSENKDASQSTVSQSAADASQPEASRDVEMKDTLQSEKDPEDVVKTVGEKVQLAKEEGANDVLSTPDKSVSQQPIGSASAPENGTAGGNPNIEGKKEKDICEGTKDKYNIEKLKRAAISAISAAAVKAKNLAKQEEDQIRQLSGSLIEKQLHKLEAKLSIFNEAESLTMRVREQLERSRQRLYHERAQIIAARLGVPPSMSSKASLPTNRIAANFANVAQRPPMGMAFPRPPMPRPPGFPVPGSFVAATTMTGSSDPSPGSDNVSSV
ncbi:DNA-binding family protein [Arabidopsis thaliana]|uniref:Isoform 2 of SWI/SNF complex subunit SWI3D n=1 Tax=Arabidopsis thaliana TaxID=3702 RepID=Q8VY05-2|nr:DNA-binding family protein [Arabidopsis thaliana]AEE86375.1 DNA-binding family protein [Arabidopsis thaliana]|eukprot:NP_195169.3 DNA-binding family protein [Arabidopsis thaliana]